MQSTAGKKSFCETSGHQTVCVINLHEEKSWIKNIPGTVRETPDNTAWDLEFIVTQKMIDANVKYYTLNILATKTAVLLCDSICAGTSVGKDSEYYGYGWVRLTSIYPTRWLSTQADYILFEGG